MKEKNNKNGGEHARIGAKFWNEIEEIKDQRLRDGTSKERLSTEKITNIITAHKFWKQIKEDIILIPGEEISKYGK
jgi:hypothetical protein